MTGYLLDNQRIQDQAGPLTLKQRLSVLIILIIIIFISYLPLLVGNIMLVDMGISQMDLMFFLLFSFLPYFFMSVCPIIAMRISPQLVSFDIIWFRKKRSEIVWSFLLPLVAIISTAVIHLLLKQLGMQITGGTLLLTTNTAFLIAYLFGAALIGPIVEEIFWRGFIQDRLEKVFAPWIALFAQAIAFAAVHIRPTGGFFGVFAIGLIFGFWRCRRKTLLPLIFAHIIMNSLWCVRFWHNHTELAKIDIKVNYVAEYNKITKPANYDPNENAVPYYQKAFELMVDMPNDTKELRKAWPADMNDAQLEMVKNWVQSNTGAFEQLKLGTQKLYYCPEYQGNSMWDVLMPSLAEARRLTYAICSRAKLDAMRGNFKAAFADLLVGYRFGTHFTGPKVLIKQLVGVTISSIAVQTAFQILDRATPEPDLLGNFQQRFQTLSSKGMFVVDFTAEKLLVYDSIQRMFTDDGKGSGHIPEAGLQGAKKAFELSEKELRNLEQLDRRQTAELTDKVYDYFNRAAHKTPWQLHEEGKDIKKVAEEMAEENSLLHLLMPAFGRAIQVSYYCGVYTDALITTLAVLRYKADKGQLPENLDQIVATGYLEELPMDPYSNKPLVYRRIGDDFTLYSFGADFDDDGGTRSKWGEGKEGGDQVFWPVQPTEKSEERQKENQGRDSIHS